MGGRERSGSVFCSGLWENVNKIPRGRGGLAFVGYVRDWKMGREEGNIYRLMRNYIL